MNTPTKRMLIDASHADETRVAIMDGSLLDDFEAETADKAQLKGNIYIGHVSRVEPSLQAAFITYGGNRNGFLAFGEVHPQFFSLPKAEKAELLDEISDQAERRRGHLREDGSDEDEGNGREESRGNGEEGESQSATVASDALSDEDAEAARKAAQLAEKAEPSGSAAYEEGSGRSEGRGRERGEKKRQPPIYRRYRIQDVLKEGQKILVQVVKEERGSKGAALTTYFSMPGRYTVLMPNTPYAGGISRKITDPEERRQLRDMYAALKIPPSMGLIIRTAGLGQEIKHIVSDYENLRNLWDNVQKGFEANDDIQCLHEDGSLIIRALRDMMGDDIEEVMISGKRAYKIAKDFSKNLMPDAAKLIKEYKEETPLFANYKVEQKLNHLHFSRVTLPSGGYMIINPTEALVAVDINSGRNTHERNIEETALKTNLEACEELGRQIRLRDLAGLIVVDFIDMEDNRNVRKVENAMRKVLRRDRARVQYNNISDFGLMEISRQRLRPSFGESHFVACPHCQGSGHVHAPSTAALMVLRRLEEEDVRTADRVVVTAATPLVMWILNQKRGVLAEMEAKYKYHLVFKCDDSLVAPDHKLELVRVKADGTESTQNVEVTLREQPELPPEQRVRGKGGPRRDRDDEGGSGGERREARDRGRDRNRDDRGSSSAKASASAQASVDRSEDRPRRDSEGGESREASTSEETNTAGGEPRRDRGGRDGGRGRDDRGGRGRDRGRDRGGRGGRDEGRRPMRVGEDESSSAAPVAEGERPVREARPEGHGRDRDGGRDRGDRGGRGPGAGRGERRIEAKVEIPLPAYEEPKLPAEPAEDKPLLVQKVAVSDEDTPVIVSTRKKMAVKVQEDTDATDEPLKVEKVTEEAATGKTRKGLIGRIIG